MELKIFTNIKELEKLIAKYPQAAHDAQVSRVTEASEFMEGEIKDLAPVGAGPKHLRDTIFQKVNVFGQNVQGIVGTPAKYGEAVELGTRPHFPPVAPILFWVKKQLGLTGKEAVSVAHAIVRKIGKKGTNATPFFLYAVTRNEAKVIRILEQIPADIIKQVQGN